MAEFRARCGVRPPDPRHLPADIPHTPEFAYGREWKGWGDFLGASGTAPRGHAYRNFEDARAFARALGLRSAAEWKAWSRGARLDLGRRPPDIPSHPEQAYRDRGWRGVADFLGTKSRRAASP